MNYDTFDKRKNDPDPEGELLIKNKQIREKEQDNQNQNADCSINRNEIDNDNDNNENEILNFDTFFMIRCFTVLLGITLISLNTIYGFVLPNNNIECIMDKLHDLTSNFNKFFHENIQARHFLIIISSLCVDTISIIASINWACYGKSWRIVTTLVLFYGFRAIIQVIKFLLLIILFCLVLFYYVFLIFIYIYIYIYIYYCYIFSYSYYFLFIIYQKN
jgi:hypothetical protein